jgi:hypothetical protein
VAADGAVVEYVTTGMGEVSPNGQSLALYREPNLYRYDLASGDTVRLHDSVRGFSWAPASDRLAVATSSGVDVVDLDGTLLNTVATPQNPYGFASDYVFEPAFMSDGRLLMGVAYSRLWILDPVEDRGVLLPYSGNYPRVRPR